MITAIPLSDSMADVVISNCVINLVPEQDKNLVFQEAFRILKPGGRMAVSDILLEKELPKDVKEDIVAYVACIAGASMQYLYREWMAQAGFQGTNVGLCLAPCGLDLNSGIDVLFVKRMEDLNIYQESVNSEGKR